MNASKHPEPNLPLRRQRLGQIFPDTINAEKLENILHTRSELKITSAIECLEIQIGIIKLVVGLA